MSAETFFALESAEIHLREEREVQLAVADAAARGWFTPQEEAVLVDWFARFLTVRAALWDLLADKEAEIDHDTPLAVRRTHAPFLVGFAAACLLIRLDRYFLDVLAVHSVVQRKFNEGVPEHRIPRKMYKEILSTFTNPSVAYRLYRAMYFFDEYFPELAREEWHGLYRDLVDRMPTYRALLSPQKRNYFRRLINYHDHSGRRLTISSFQQVLFNLLEMGGRLLSDWTVKPEAEHAVTGDIIEKLRPLLQPGDVFITRHRYAATNWFLPGYWPHAALYTGSELDRRRIDARVSQEVAEVWTGQACVLEALKDGVRFRTLESTLSVDAFVVIRPQLDQTEIAKALTRVAVHEGKGYNFDFDFFRSDKLVCTEVVYRAFDGLGDLSFAMTSRFGRPTLSAEDILELAVDGRGFDLFAHFDPEKHDDLMATGEQLEQRRHLLK